MYDLDGKILSFNTADYTYDEETKIYTVNFEGADGYDYHLYFAIGSTYVGYGYNVYAMTREETVESEDGYKVVFERVIASDANLAQGAFYSIKLFKKDGDGGDYVEVESATNIYAPSLSKVYYVLREKTEDGKITSTTYYTIEITEKTDAGVGSDEEEKPVSEAGPYVIPPEQFGDDEEYEQISLTYYADGVLADENDEVIEDVEDAVGIDSLNHFGEYEDDSVFVRNDARKCDYEILLDQRTYSEVVEDMPHQMEV